VAYDDTIRAELRVEDVYRELIGLASQPTYEATDVVLSTLAQFSARSQAAKLAALLAEAVN
jgi:hypothetical protein